MTVLETVAAVGMAVGPPLAYSDQVRGCRYSKENDVLTCQLHDHTVVLVRVNLAQAFIRWFLPRCVRRVDRGQCNTCSVLDGRTLSTRT